MKTTFKLLTVVLFSTTILAACTKKVDNKALVRSYTIGSTTYTSLATEFKLGDLATGYSRLEDSSENSSKTEVGGVTISFDSNNRPAAGDWQIHQDPANISNPYITFLASDLNSTDSTFNIYAVSPSSTGIAKVTDINGKIAVTMPNCTLLGQKYKIVPMQPILSNPIGAEFTTTLTSAAFSE